MKIKLDENLPRAVASRLVAMGHDAQTVVEEGIAGKADLQVWEAAQREGRFLITQDMHFSDARRFAPGTHEGILLVRLHAPNWRALVARLEKLFAREDVAGWARCFVVATEHKVRARRAVTLANREGTGKQAGTPRT
jgi:predicted nuclease of predicted toxin-antitoxin system